MNLLQKLLENLEFKTSVNLFEDLGNLNSLNLGSMINVLKQSYNDNSENHNKIMYHHIGKNSIIKDGPSVHNLSSLRKAFNVKQDNIERTPEAIALYYKATPVCFILNFADDISSSSSKTRVRIAYDLTKFSDEAKANPGLLHVISSHFAGRPRRSFDDSDVSKTNLKSAQEHYLKTRVFTDTKLKQLRMIGKSKQSEDFTDYKEWLNAVKKEFKANKWDLSLESNDGVDKAIVNSNRGKSVIGIFDEKTSKGRVEYYEHNNVNDNIDYVYDGKTLKYEGLVIDSKSVGNVVENISNILGGKLESKLVYIDQDRIDKQNNRRANAPYTNEDLAKLGDNLKARLLKFKNAKLGDDVTEEQLIDTIFSGSDSKINFNGKTYKLNSKRGSVNMKDFLKGETFDVKFDQSGGYGTLYVTLKLEKDKTIKVVSII